MVNESLIVIINDESDSVRWLLHQVTSFDSWYNKGSVFVLCETVNTLGIIFKYYSVKDCESRKYYLNISNGMKTNYKNVLYFSKAPRCKC